MSKYTAGFVGAGNMGGALALSACRAVEPKEIIVSCKTEEEAQAVAKKLGSSYGSASDVVRNSKFVFLGVKPQMLNDVVSELAEDFAESDCIVVSMLAGVKIEKLESLFGKEKKIIRIMPNTPCTVGKGMMLMCVNDAVYDAEIEDFKSLMKRSGIVDEIPENLIDAASAVSGCGPAFVYMFIEALADGGVKCGLPRDKALRYAAQTLAGSAAMVLETGSHPEALKDAVCSPGGSTIEGVHALENGAFRCSTIDAVETAFRRTKELG